MQGKELRKKVVKLNEAGLINDFLDGIEDILEEINTPFYSTMQSRKVDIGMPIYEIFEKLEENREFFLSNTEEEKQRLKEHHKNLMEGKFGNEGELNTLKEMFSGLLKNDAKVKEEYKRDYEEESTPRRSFLSSKPVYQRNDKVTVKYTNGKTVENTKYKKVEKDIKEGKCFIV